MGYYMRAFCTEPTVPSLADVVDWTKAKGCPVQIDPEAAAEGPEATDWLIQQVPILYKQGKNPFLVEISRKGTEGTLFEDEIAEFIEAVGETRWSPAKNKVIKHLRSVQYTFVCQLLTSDLDDDGLDAAGWFTAYFIDTDCGGMIQADGEGFYINRKLVVKLD